MFFFLRILALSSIREFMCSFTSIFFRIFDDTLEKLEEKGIPEAIAKTALELG